MAADFGLISDAAQADTDKLTPQCAGDRFPQRGFPDSRWADEAENRALHFLFELSDGQVFQDSFLDLLEVVVVVIQYFGGSL